MDTSQFLSLFLKSYSNFIAINVHPSSKQVLASHILDPNLSFTKPSFTAMGQHFNMSRKGISYYIDTNNLLKGV